ncbi:MAG: hypothetical protein JJ895_04925 [Balneolaceae bacterium]|nr:hypothetical protein [Balneolaceae bacterium]
MPNGAVNRYKSIKGAKELEIYEQARYLTITGQVLYGKLKPIKEIDDSFWNLLPKDNSSIPSLNRSGELTNGDQRIIDNLLKNKNDGQEFRNLYVYGDLTQYEGDQSRADLRLVHFFSKWCGFDADRINRLFRSSKLMRPKWDKKHRLDGATYGQMTIEKALSNRHIHHKSEIEGYLKYHYDFRYNEVLDRVELKPKKGNEWELLSKREFNSLHRKIKNDGGTIGAESLNSLLESDFSPTYNPMIEYFTKNSVCTGTSAIEQLAATVATTDQSYWTTSLTK